MKLTKSVRRCRASVANFTMGEIEEKAEGKYKDDKHEISTRVQVDLGLGWTRQFVE
jgi:hypothetical protein